METWYAITHTPMISPSIQWVYELGITLHVLAGICLVIALVIWSRYDILAQMLVALMLCLMLSAFVAYGIVWGPAYERWMWIFSRNAVFMVIASYCLAYPVRKVQVHSWSKV
jgi:hypothetical protein